MKKTKYCYECGEAFEIEEDDVVDGLITIPGDDAILEALIAWICPECRLDVDELSCLNDSEEAVHDF